MSGKLVGIAILLGAAAAGAALYYLQVYGFYHEVAGQPGREVQLVKSDGQLPVVIEYSDFRAIDADSSPIRYRACFATVTTPGDLAAEHVVLADVIPRNAPGWFDCFDAERLAGELEAGTAIAFLGTKNIAFGVDRIVAITDDGRGYAWHELNECGKKSYDGTVVGETCPPRPAAASE